MRFGVFLPTYGRADFNYVTEVAVTAERLGFNSLWVGDHLVNPDWQVVPMGGEPGKPETLDPYIALATVAVMTRKVRLGACVTPVPRSQTPMHLAKTVATLDIVSGGRAILGAGAGWYEKEFRTYGFSWDKYQVRFKKMWEGVEIIKKMWTETPVSYTGKYYKVSDAILLPKPIQKPYPPIWFGGNSVNILRATASLGDGWVPFTIDPHTYKERLSILKELLRQAGREFTQIEPAYSTHAHIGVDYDAVQTKIGNNLKIWSEGSSGVGRLERRLAREREIESSCILGGSEDCIKRIEEYAKAGVKHLVFHPIPFNTALSSLKMFAKKVMPHFKE